ncbi:hypothetical protein C2S53_004811 [Perilla frutescens var. hirtella]|uniref:Cytochrome P450 n=1 Tax=Perilla frutescens var. hirtella TaxID=608512 RepID=A0AAD4PBC5_PERFH|nr:hypothetical protein C2S53_004811 [Perilla frutescens var. hirtella]
MLSYHFSLLSIMENISWLILAVVSVGSLTILSKIINNNQRRKLPPGPKPWPIIGNLNLLGSIPHQSLHHLAQKYGEIMLLKFGKFPVVIASSPEMARQFLKVHDAVFASRPALAAGKYISYNYSDVSFAPYGTYWREARKIFKSEIFNNKKLEYFEQIRIEERRRFLSRLQSLSGKPVVLRDHLSRLTLSTICRMVLSTNKYFTESEEDENSNIVNMDELREMMKEWFLLAGAFNIGDWIPWLSSLDLQGYVKKMKTLRQKMDRFSDYVIDDHIARRAAAGNDCENKDFVDILLHIVEDGTNLDVEITRDCVKALMMNLLLGGTDTSATTVEWAIHEILKQPRIMKKAKEEVERVIGRKRWVEEKDFTNHELPYIDAIIMETFRLHPLATLLSPHYAIENCNVSGYDISKGTTIIINTWSIGRDPNSWDEAEEFLPERFIGKEIDMLGSNFALLPFGSGRRRCSGYNLGLKIVRTTLANLLHGFEMKLVEGMRPQDICMDEVYGLATSPKHPLSIIMEPTLSTHLY